MANDPTYFYRVEEFMTSFERDKPNYVHFEDFSHGGLLECRRSALEYFNRQQSAYNEQGQFFNKVFYSRNGFDLHRAQLILFRWS